MSQWSNRHFNYLLVFKAKIHGLPTQRLDTQAGEMKGFSGEKIARAEYQMGLVESWFTFLRVCVAINPKGTTLSVPKRYDNAF